MARQQNITIDRSLTLKDILTGLDEHKITKNFQLCDLADFQASLGLSDPGRTALIWRRIDVNSIVEPGQYKFLDNNEKSFATDFTTPQRITVSRYATNGQDCLPLLQTFEDNDVKGNIITGNEWAYGIFALSQVLVVTADTITIELLTKTRNDIPVASSGAIPAADVPNNFLAITPLGVASGGAGRSINKISISAADSEGYHNITFTYNDGTFEEIPNAFKDGIDGRDGIDSAKPDWDADESAPAGILNKPPLPEGTPIANWSDIPTDEEIETLIQVRAVTKWVDALTYNINDVVLYESKIYRCMFNNQFNITPGTSNVWEVLLDGGGNLFINITRGGTFLMADGTKLPSGNDATDINDITTAKWNTVIYENNTYYWIQNIGLPRSSIIRIDNITDGTIVASKTY